MGFSQEQNVIVWFSAKKEVVVIDLMSHGLGWLEKR